MESKTAVACLSALAHGGRLKAFRLLVQAGPSGLAAGELARRLEMPANSLSTNLSILAHADLVRPRREGRSIIYTVAYDRMRDLLGFLLEDCCGGAPEICSPLAQTLQSACCVPASQETA